MKKFFSLSVFLHLSLFALLASHFHMPHQEENHTSYVTISLSKPPSLSPPPFKNMFKKKVKTSNESKNKLKAKKNKNFKAKEARKSAKQSAKPTIASKGDIKKKKLSYKEELYQFFKNKNHYPPIAAKLKQSGQVRVKISINKNGYFEKVTLSKKSNYTALNKGTLSFIKKVKKFKPLPENLNSETFEVPIIYEL